MCFSFSPTACTRIEFQRNNYSRKSRQVHTILETVYVEDPPTHSFLFLLRRLLSKSVKLSKRSLRTTRFLKVAQSTTLKTICEFLQEVNCRNRLRYLHNIEYQGCHIRCRVYDVWTRLFGHEVVWARGHLDARSFFLFLTN